LTRVPLKEEDLVGIRTRDVIGVGVLLWSADYPYTGSSWRDAILIACAISWSVGTYPRFVREASMICKSRA
jgi:hypothetical protein